MNRIFQNIIDQGNRDNYNIPVAPPFGRQPKTTGPDNDIMFYLRFTKPVIRLA